MPVHDGDEKFYIKHGAIKCYTWASVQALQQEQVLCCMLHTRSHVQPRAATRLASHLVIMRISTMIHYHQDTLAIQASFPCCRDRDKQSRSEQIGVDQSRSEQIRADQIRSDQSRSEQIRAYRL